MPIDDEQKDGFLLNIWQAITLVGDVRERSDEIDPSELETVLTDAESLLIGAVSEAAQRPGGPTRHRRVLRFWKAMRDTPSDHVSWRGATSVIPFPGSMISGASPCLSSNESAAPKTSTARFPRLNPGRTERARPWYRNRSGLSVGQRGYYCSSS